MSKLTAEQMKEQIRASIKQENMKGLWWNFWRNIEFNSYI